jgi:hypothetical protein
LKRFSPKILRRLVAMCANILPTLKVFDKIPDVPNKTVFGAVNISADFTVSRPNGRCVAKARPSKSNVLNKKGGFLIEKIFMMHEF